MALTAEQMWVIAAGGVARGLLASLCSKDFMTKHRRWADLVLWPGRRLDQGVDWMYEHMHLAAVLAA